MYDVCCRPSSFERGREEWSRAHQLVFPRRGVFEREVRGERLIADSNHVLFFNRDQAYRVAHPAGAGDDCTVFTFEEELLWEAVRSQDPAWADAGRAAFRFSHTLNTQAVFLLQDQLRRLALTATGERLALDEAAVQLLGAVLHGAYCSHGIAPRLAPKQTLRAHHEQVRRTSLFLATHFREGLALHDVARAVHCSPFHLARLFRRHSGLTIHQYRQRLRLREGLRRLAESETDLSALSLELGFSSHSHFSDSFRQAFGLSPSACRKSLSCRRLRELSKNMEVAVLDAT
jgi:AraC family transcriptional regulator